MGRSHRRQVLAVLTAGFLVLISGLAMAGGEPKAAAASGDKPVFRILVAGDSYSAGNGAGNYSTDAENCRRSPHNYAGIFAAMLNKARTDQVATVKNIACSGDTTDAFWHTTAIQPLQIVWANGHLVYKAKVPVPPMRPAQINSVNGNYDLIFLTVGGNDLDFSGVVFNCLLPWSKNARNCKYSLDQAQALLDDGTISQRVTTVLNKIRVTNDHATVVLLGYPYMESDPTYTLKGCKNSACAGKGGGILTVAAGERIRNIGLKGDSKQQAAVDAANSKYHTNRFVFISTKKLFRGHELSASSINLNRWMVQPTFSTISDSDLWYHPNLEGWIQEAAMLMKEARVPKAPPIIRRVSPTPTPSPSQQAQTLSVHLSANYSGTTSSNGVSLTATVTGSAQGTINYTFYCDRSDSGTNITSGWDAKFDGISDNPKTTTCSYPNPGTFTAKVIVERGTFQAEARTTVKIDPSSIAEKVSASILVVDQFNEPVEGAKIWFEDERGKIILFPYYFVYTNKVGQINFSYNVSSNYNMNGRYIIHIEKENYSSIKGSIDITESPTAEVISPNKFVLRKWGVITGLVVSETGDPVYQARFWLTNQKGQYMGSYIGGIAVDVVRLTIKTGRLETVFVPDGQYTLNIACENYCMFGDQFASDTVNDIYAKWSKTFQVEVKGSEVWLDKIVLTREK